MNPDASPSNEPHNARPSEASLNPALRTSVIRPVYAWPFPKRIGSYTLHGYSRAAERTGFAIPELSLVFDAGVVAHAARMSNILITHTHTDHVHDLPFLKSQRKPPHIYAPKHAVDLLDDWLRSAQYVTISEPIRRDTLIHRYTLHGVEPGDEITLQGRKRPLIAEVLRCDHTVPCVGYRVCESRTRLKRELLGLPGPEIAARRAAGEEVQESTKVPIVSYLTDTTHRIFEDHPNGWQAPVVIVECSFFDPDHLETAERTHHMHWDHLQPIVHAHPDITFVLIHLSHRYKLENFAQRLPPNAVLWA